MQDVYRRRHINGVRTWVELDGLGLGYAVTVCHISSPDVRRGSWWRLEDAMRAADTAAHANDCSSCEPWVAGEPGAAGGETGASTAGRSVPAQPSPHHGTSLLS